MDAKKIIIKFFIFIIFFAFILSSNTKGQCEIDFDLGYNGTWSDCWESTNEYIVIPLPGPCYPTINNTNFFITFDTSELGVISIIIDGNTFYENQPNNYIWTHSIIYSSQNGCLLEEVFSTNSCGFNSYSSILINTYDFSNNWIDEDYSLDLILEPGEYTLIIGGVGAGNIDNEIIGCVNVTIINQGFLGLMISEWVKSNSNLPFKLWLMQNYTWDGRLKK